MKNAIWPTEYFHNPYHDKTIEQIWDDIDNFSFEDQYENPNFREEMDFVVVLPPFNHKGKFTKGIFYSQSVDLIISEFPRLKELFFPIANSMFASYPQSVHADGYFVCYDNKAKKDYYIKKHPYKKDFPLLPLQDCDFTNEYTMAPTFNTPKTIDVFCVSTAYPVKNMPMLAQAFKTFEEKYHKTLKVVYAIGNRDAIKLPDSTMDYSKVRYDAKEQLAKVDEILGDTKKYIDFYPYIEYVDLPKYYTAAKCCVLGSLLEGKNRFLSEAMLCDTPVITFKDFNKYVRGDYPVFFGNSGEYAPQYTPESMADTIFKVINFPQNYDPRRNYLMHSGRKRFVNTCIDAFPYFRENIPDYQEGRILDNLWVDLACQSNYQISYFDFIYSRNPAVSYVRGMTAIKSLVEFFFARFGIH